MPQVEGQWHLSSPLQEEIHILPCCRGAIGGVALRGPLHQQRWESGPETGRTGVGQGGYVWIANRNREHQVRVMQ